MSAPDLESWFPNLRHSPYQITSPRDPSYNCVAWAAGNAQQWWWPGTSFWPGPAEETVGCFVSAFQSLGYEVCESRDLEPGFEKVALYCKDGEPQHVSRQVHAGLWTSKCGKGEDITHTLEGLEGSDYGEVTIILRRPLGGPLAPSRSLEPWRREALQALAAGVHLDADGLQRCHAKDGLGVIQLKDHGGAHQLAHELVPIYYRVIYCACDPSASSKVRVPLGSSPISRRRLAGTRQSTASVSTRNRPSHVRLRSVGFRTVTVT